METQVCAIAAWSGLFSQLARIPPKPLKHKPIPLLVTTNSKHRINSWLTLNATNASLIGIICHSLNTRTCNPGRPVDNWTPKVPDILSNKHVLSSRPSRRPSKHQRVEHQEDSVILQPPQFNWIQYLALVYLHMQPVKSGAWTTDLPISEWAAGPPQPQPPNDND